MGEEIPGAGFAAQTAVVRDPVEPGRYLTGFGGQWNAPRAPLGGLVMAAAVRAMREELDDPVMELRSVTVMFVERIVEGPAVAEVDVLRRGRSMAQVSASLRSEGAASGLVAQAVFGREREGFAFTDPRMPDAPPVEECLDVHEVMAAQGVRLEVPVMEQVQMRVPPAALKGRAAGGESVNWYRLAEQPPRIDGFVDPLVFLPLSDMMAGAIAQRPETGGRQYIAPSCDLTVHVVARAKSEWLLARAHAVHAAEGYVSLALDLWDPECGLVARTTQTAFLTFP